MLHQYNKSRTSSLHLQLETPGTETLNATPQKNRTLYGKGVEEEKGAGSRNSL